jgi:hypothetical protein
MDLEETEARNDYLTDRPTDRSIDRLTVAEAWKTEESLMFEALRTVCGYQSEKGGPGPLARRLWAKQYSL